MSPTLNLMRSFEVLRLEAHAAELTDLQPDPRRISPRHNFPQRARNLDRHQPLTYPTCLKSDWTSGDGGCE